MSDSASYTQVTGKLDCNKCVWGTRDGGCASWECEFIDRDDAVKAWRNMPSAQPERKTGKWIHKHCVWFCSECGENPTKGTGYVQGHDELYDFCPKCGADMRGEEL